MAASHTLEGILLNKRGKRFAIQACRDFLSIGNNPPVSHFKTTRWDQTRITTPDLSLLLPEPFQRGREQ